MFEPNFVITPRIVQLYGRIEAAKALLTNTQLTPDWDLRFREEAFLRNVFFTSRLMGVTMTLPSIERIVKDDPSRDETPAQVALRLGIAANETQLQIVMNLRNGYRYADQIARLGKRMGGVSFGEKELSHIHTILNERVIQSHLLGIFRMGEVEEIIGLDKLISPLGVECSYQMEDWGKWYLSVETSSASIDAFSWPVVLAEILRIRPYTKNNLGTICVFLNLIMSADGYNSSGYLSIVETLYSRWNKIVEGYKSLEVRGTHTLMIEEFLEIVALVMEQQSDKVRRLSGDLTIKSNFAKQVALSERQMALLSVAQMREVLTMSDARSVLPSVSDDTILRDLKVLVDKKMIKKKGKTKGVRYILVR